MRAVRGLAMAAVVISVLIPATWAGADGGAYVDLQRTHYLPGQTAVGETYISVPRTDQDQLDRGSGVAGSQPFGSGSVSATASPLPDATLTRKSPGTFESDTTSPVAPSSVSSVVDRP